MELTIILPAYNEESIIARTLSEHLTWQVPSDVDLQNIIVVDDGSTDHTADIVSDFATAHPLIRLVRHSVNCGKGAALKTGVSSIVSSDIIGCIDSDLAYPPTVYADFLIPFHRETVDLAIGNRYHASRAGLARYPLIRRIASHAFRHAARTVIPHPVSDSQCGIKFFTREAAEFLFGRLHSTGFLYDLDILSTAVACEMRIREVPVVMHLQAESALHIHRQILPVLKEIIRLRRMRRSLPPQSIIRSEWLAIHSDHAGTASSS
ncbi:glycosyltransferase family 2 protein [bacterium]|nr:glycosyltransferase family 2 protein [candidate division CSSED10-310 bacterium]